MEVEPEKMINAPAQVHRSIDSPNANQPIAAPHTSLAKSCGSTTVASATRNA
jgi:hypothetical protein